MAGVSFGGGASANRGGVSAYGNAQVSGNPLAGLGGLITESVDKAGSAIAAGASTGAELGGAAGGPMGAVLGAVAGGVAGRVSDVMGAFMQIPGNQLEAIGKGAMGLLTGNTELIGEGVAQYGAGLAQLYSGGLLRTVDAWQGPIGHAHTPPPPRASLEASGRISVEGRIKHDASIKTRFGVENGGWAKHCGASFDVKANSNLQIHGGKFTASQRLELSDTFSATARVSVGGKASIGGQLGFDLAARCSTTLGLSEAITSGGPKSVPFQALMGARFECGGGFAHLRGFFSSNTHVDIRQTTNINISIGNGHGRTHGPHGPQPHGNVSGPGGKAPVKEPAAEGSGGFNIDEPSTFLNDPGLSFEDKIFMFMMSLCKKQEDKILGMMARWDDRMKAKDGAGKKGADGGAGKAPGADSKGGAPGLPGMGGGGSPVGMIVGLAKQLGPMALDLAASTSSMWVPALMGALGSVVPVAGNFAGGIGGMAASGVVGGGLSSVSGAIKGGALDGIFDSVAGAAGGGGGAAGGLGGMLGPLAGAAGGGKAGAAGKSGGADKPGPTTFRNASEAAGGDEVDKIQGDGPESEQRFTQLLTKAQQDLTKMFEMLGNLSKASHDSQMGAIRNMK